MSGGGGCGVGKDRDVARNDTRVLKRTKSHSCLDTTGEQKETFDGHVCILMLQLGH